MVISSGISPMAYVLSNINDFSSTNENGQCNHQRLFKFDPKKFKKSPDKSIKTTSSSTNDNCGHLGLIFGRN
jgi:hypothetical protein